MLTYTSGMRWQRVAWLVWCGLWAAVWLAGAGQALMDYERYDREPGAGMDMLINLALVAGSLLLMLAPVGKKRWPYSGEGASERIER